MMSRFLIRFILIPICLLIGAALLIRSQVHDDTPVGEVHNLHDVLPPERCPAPCFMGIRPGVTTSKEAITLLKNNVWVDQVVPNNTENPYQIWWTWSKDAPDFLKTTPTNPNFPVNGEVHSNSDIVTGIYFTPNLTLDDIVQLWGLPDESQLIFGGIIIAPDPSRSAITALPYETDGFWASGDTLCPYAENVWETPVRLRITDQFHEISLGNVYPVPRATFLDSIRDISLKICGL